MSDSKFYGVELAINLSILDFKNEKMLDDTHLKNTINLSILDFKTVRAFYF